MTASVPFGVAGFSGRSAAAKYGRGGQWGRFESTPTANVVHGTFGSWGAWTEVVGAQATDIVVTAMESNWAQAAYRIGYGPSSSVVTHVAAGVDISNEAYALWPCRIPAGNKVFVSATLYTAVTAQVILHYIAAPNRAQLDACRISYVANTDLRAINVPASGYGAWKEVAPSGLLPPGRYKVFNVWNVMGAFQTGIGVGIGPVGSEVQAVLWPRFSYPEQISAIGTEMLYEAFTGSDQSGRTIQGGQQVHLRLAINTFGSGGPGVTTTFSPPIFVSVDRFQ